MSHRALTLGDRLFIWYAALKMTRAGSRTLAQSVEQAKGALLALYDEEAWERCEALKAEQQALADFSFRFLRGGASEASSRQ